MPFNEKLFSYKFVDDQSFEQDSTESQTTEKNTTAQEQTTEPPATTESENIYEEDYSNIDWDNKKDSDDDGLPDVMELYQYGTNVLEKDSDGDGLQDGYEVLHTFTNPSKKDTDENGINDGYEDLDEDGLSNLEEYNIGSEPLLKDMDEDGLSDGDEATYGTKYDIADTDGDGINDFDEIQLSFNPNKKETHPGIPDSEYEISQSLSEKELSDVNDCIDEFNVSIDVTATNNLKTHMQVELEEGNNVINSNNALVGEPISVNYYEGKISSGEIRFSLSAEELKDENKYFEEDYGIKRYSIFSYDEQENMIIPVKCKYDVSNNEISIDASCNMGILFLMDIEEMLHSMGSNDLAGNTHNEMPKANCSKPVDLVFAVDASLSNRGTITQLQRELNDFVAKLNSNNINLRMSFIRYLDVKFNGKGSTWVNYYSEDFLTNVSDMTNMINKIEPEGASRYSSIIEPLCYSNELEYRDNATKIVVVFTSSPMNQENSFGYGEIGDILKKLKKNDINVCIAGTNNLEAVYSYIPGYNGGKGIYMTNSYMKQLYNYIDKMAGTEYDYNAVALNNLAPVFLDEKLIKGAACDTDGDGLTDSQETDWSKLADLMDSTGKTSIVLPSLKKVWDSMGVSYNTDGIMQCLLEQKVLPVISFPNLMDSDGDDLIDSKDSDVLQYNPYEIDDSLLDDSLTPPDASENRVAKANVFMSMKKAPTISNPTVRNVDVKDGICTYKFASSKNKKRTLIGELKPVKNSDYTVRVVSKSGFKNKDTSIKVYYKKGKKKKVYVDSYKSSTKSISVKEKHYILKQNKTYYIEFICKTEKNEDVRVECNQETG